MGEQRLERMGLRIAVPPEVSGVVSDIVGGVLLGER